MSKTTCSSKQYHVLTLCYSCFPSNNTTMKRYKNDRNLISVRCCNPLCKRSWSYCSLCPKSIRFLKQAQVKRHIVSKTHIQLKEAFEAYNRQQVTSMDQTTVFNHVDDIEIPIPTINVLEEATVSIDQSNNANGTTPTPTFSFFDPSYPNTSLKMENFFIYENVITPSGDDEMHYSYRVDLKLRT